MEDREREEPEAKREEGDRDGDSVAPWLRRHDRDGSREACGVGTGLSRNSSPGSAGWAAVDSSATMTAARPVSPAPALGSGRRHAIEMSIV
jgi:hypothetical protein